MSALEHQEGGTHYAKLKIQPIEYIHANGIGFAEGSVIKYVTRWRDKNGIADLKKARHFIDLLIELEEKNHILDATKKVWTHDKELPSSGIYADESGYTEQDMQAASLVHDCDLDEQRDSGKLGCDPHHVVKLSAQESGEIMAQVRESLGIKPKLDADLISLCSKTEIHADADGWIKHVGSECPLSDGDTLIDICGRFNDGGAPLINKTGNQAKAFDWAGLNYRIDDWRYHKGE